MKNKGIIMLMVAFVFCTALESCASSGATYAENTNQRTNLLNLQDWLRTLNGVRIVGTKVVIGSAQQDFQMGFQGALIVLDGDIIGRNYKAAGRLIPDGTVKSIKVLSNAESARYGSKAFEGVIVITTTDEAAR